jgi:hypothetical protein
VKRSDSAGVVDLTLVEEYNAALASAQRLVFDVLPADVHPSQVTLDANQRRALSELSSARQRLAAYRAQRTHPGWREMLPEAPPDPEGDVRLP